MKSQRTFEKNIQKVMDVLTEEEFKNFMVEVIKDDGRFSRYLYKIKLKSAESVIDNAFFWSDTKQGREYWRDIYYSIIRSER